MKITIVCDNYVSRQDLIAGWGFSCLIETQEENVLFDLGESEETFSHNFSMLGINPEKIHTVVISHDHHDHTGGLRWFLGANPRVNICVLSSFSKETKDIVRHFGAKPVSVDKVYYISDKLCVIAMKSFINEQFLLIKTSKGLVIITGCSHPGIIDIVEEAKSIGDVYMLLGGFHLLGETREELENIAEKLKESGVKKISPCHCSGDRTRKVFSETFGENFMSCGAGRVIKL